MAETDTLRRYRLTGGLFLLALAAILGPMLFDGAGLDAPELRPMPAVTGAAAVVPPEGAFDDLDAVTAEAAVLRQRIDDAQFERSERTTTASSKGEEVPGGSPAPISEDGSEAIAASAETQVLERPRLAQPSLEPLSAGTSIWAVQVGSFSRRDNAVALRQSLRDQGFEAFLSEVSVRDQIRTRVAVGPYLSEQDASSARSQIARRFDLEARLVAMVI